MTSTTPPLPRRIASRADARALWRHVAAQGIAFQLDQAPTEGLTLRAVTSGLPLPVAAQLTRLCQELTLLDDRAVLEDAVAAVRTPAFARAA